MASATIGMAQRRGPLAGLSGSFATTAEGALATTTADPLRRANADAVVHLYDNVREISGTLDLPRKDVAVLGRCWADSPRYNDLARVWTVPLSASSFKNGFRCAKSAAPPNDSRVPAP